MSLNIGEAIKTGFTRAATVPGAIFAVGILALGLASTLTVNSILRTVLLENEAVRQAIEENPEITYEEFTTTMEGQIPLGFLDVDPVLLGIGFVALLIVQFVFTIGVIRWFTEAADQGLYAGLFTRRLLWTVGNLILAMIVFAVILGGIPLIVVAVAGLVGGELIALLAGLALIIPLLYVYVALYFYNFEIIVEGANAIDAFGNSWGLTMNNRLSLFFLGAIFVIASLVLGLVVGAVTAVSPLVNVLSTQVLNAALAVVGIGITAAAYNQLRGTEPASVGAAGPDAL
jgi:hypothetical protein